MRIVTGLCEDRPLSSPAALFIHTAIPLPCTCPAIKNPKIYAMSNQLNNTCSPQLYFICQPLPRPKTLPQTCQNFKCSYRQNYTVAHSPNQKRKAQNHASTFQSLGHTQFVVKPNYHPKCLPLNKMKTEQSLHQIW